MDKMLIVLAPKKNQNKNCFQDGDFGKKMIEAAHILKKYICKRKFLNPSPPPLPGK